MSKGSGPKKVTCSICGQEVLKARTRCIGDGKRACKIHDGVMEQAESVYNKAAQEKKDREQREKAKRIKRAERWKSPEQEPLFTLRCHICRCETVHAQDLLLESLIMSKALEMRDIPSPLFFALDQIEELVRAKFGSRKAMYVYTQEELSTDEWRRAMNALSRRKRELAEQFGFVAVCIDCMARLGLPDKLSRNLQSPPKMDLKAMWVLGSVVESALEREVKRRENSGEI